MKNGVLAAIRDLRDAAARIAEVGEKASRYYELNARRIESLGELDAESAQAVEDARRLLMGTE